MSEEVTGQDTGAEQTVAAETQVATNAAETQAPEAAATSGEAPAGEQGEQQDKPKDGRLQVRFSELTGQRDAAQREAQERAAEAEYWRSQALAAQRQQSQPHQQAGAADGAPDPSQYPLGDIDPAYLQDMVDYRVTTTLAATLEQREAQSRQAQVRQQNIQKIETLRTTLFESGLSGAQLIASGGDIPCSPAMIDAMAVSDNPAAVADFLGNNRAEAARIAALPDVQQGFELARISARLANPQVKTTRAPEPTPTVTGLAPASDSFSPTMSQADFEAAIERKHGGFYGRS